MAGEWVEVTTQAELDRVVAAGDIAVCKGSGRFVARGSSHVVAWGSSHVVAWGSSHVEAWGSSHVVAWGSSHVVAWGSSHVEAWESSHVEARGSSHVEAWESSHVEARGSSHVEARGSVAVHDYGPSTTGRTKVNGGVIITVPLLDTAEKWCSYHGVTVTDGVATLYKAVRDDYRSAHRADYSPGATPEALDWDGGAMECGGGLHFAYSPAAAKAFDGQATRFMACPVALADIVVHPRGTYPSKVKARRVVAPGCVEVDIYGELLAPVG